MYIVSDDENKEDQSEITNSLHIVMGQLMRIYLPWIGRIGTTSCYEMWMTVNDKQTTR